MKKTKKFPTIIGFVVLVLGLAAGVFLVQTKQLFKIGASPDITPGNVLISNITDTSFTVTWVTSKETAGFIKLGNSATLDKTLTDSIDNPSYTHFITAKDLSPATTYFFKINSDGEDFDSNGTPWQAKTGPTLAGSGGEAINASGSVLDVTSADVAKTLVFLKVGGGDMLSGFTSDKGTWVIPIANVRTADLSNYIAIDPTQTLIEISVNAGPSGIASAQVYPQSVTGVPPMVLGETYDFRSLGAASSDTLPQASLTAPEEATRESGFNVDTQGSLPAAKKVTLDSIENNETVNTVSPEFFGKAPAGTAITITVESEDPMTDQIKAASDGTWNWEPPEDLAPGEHTVTLKWKDTTGIWQTITRTFIVSASEGPAFVATPSATLKATMTAAPTATKTPIATKTPTIKPSPTEVPDIPDSGVLTPTLVLSIMGVGAIAVALLFWKKAEY